MRSFSKFIFLFFFLFLSGYSSAQVIQLNSGSLASLKGIDSLNLEFDFSGLTVSGYPTLNDYLTFKMKKYEEQFPGAKGEEWYTNWLNEREYGMMPSIESGINNVSKWCGLPVKRKTASKYTFIVKVLHYNDSKNKNHSRITISSTGSGMINIGTYKGLTSMFETKIYLIETSTPEVKLATIRADYYNDISELGRAVGKLICDSIRK